MCARGLFSAMGALSLNILQQAHFPFGMGKLNASPAELFLQRLNSLRSDSSLC